ncbi:MAG: hypothetical protein ACOY58_08175 [Candidatus Micrarchaeota archaeon]
MESSESWHCPLSPTSAHHWHIDQSGFGRCKHCREERTFRINHPPYGDYLTRGRKAKSAMAYLERARRLAAAQLAELEE